jgi:hypothetical protein
MLLPENCEQKIRNLAVELLMIDDRFEAAFCRSHDVGEMAERSMACDSSVQRLPAYRFLMGVIPRGFESHSRHFFWPTTQVKPRKKDGQQLVAWSDMLLWCTYIKSSAGETIYPRNRQAMQGMINAQSRPRPTRASQSHAGSDRAKGTKHQGQERNWRFEPTVPSSSMRRSRFDITRTTESDDNVPAL